MQFLLHIVWTVVITFLFFSLKTGTNVCSIKCVEFCCEYFPGPHHHSTRHLVTGMPDEVKSEPLSLSGGATVASDLSDPQMGLQQPEEEEVPSPNHIPRGPSPEPKIEDTECHRSQSAM